MQQELKATQVESQMISKTVAIDHLADHAYVD
jgi:hypothetical protein